MKCAAIIFPGSSHDLYEMVKECLNLDVDLVWYKDTNLDHYDLLLLSGGFSYGDYLRPGALAARTEILAQICEKAAQGTPILAIGNGFQILLEAGLLPGAMLINEDINFICQNKNLIVRNNQTFFTTAYDQNEVISIPIAHGEGCYYCDDQTLAQLEKNNQIVFTYQDNPNGSVGNIAGIVNEQGNILGMMPHPERALETILGSEDGLRLFQSMITNWREKHVTNA
ncbi:phosphoribosylformylglycinamidine synthase subunit PurQ [Amphibacillus sp. MSJ-3]|uniref:phosphoribosylformylglycinamidine synthase subunit PurQ n=1 Tax=Amphibacillus sp. MSJ-3 TaxID=2841505 RepID=UPI001C0EB800|nr:phosphoribosylformylglycinamidine synthase subunit PurQ [Amphibacillus sp. MSJ-3]